MLDFQPIASSSDGCCYVLRSGAHPPMLIDAGVRYPLIQQALAFRVTSLAGCLVSHAHGDHCKAVPQLMKAGVDVWASRETWKSLGEGPHGSHRAKWLDPAKVEKIGPWTVQPFDAVHDMPGTLGFLVGCPDGERFLYLTDSAYSRYRFEALTHIAVECNFSREIMRSNADSGTIGFDRYKRTTQTHMSLERLIEMLLANDLSQVEEIHLLHLSDANSDEEAFKAAVMRATGKPVYVAAKQESRS